MKYGRILSMLCMVGVLPVVTLAQTASPASSFIDLTGTIGQSQGTGSLSYVHNWKIGKRGKWEIGAGGRWTVYSGTKKDFITAGPASLTRTFTFPFLIFFAGSQEENLDTLVVQRALIHSINLSLNLGYQFNPKWYVGFNIDVVGFSVGRASSSVLVSNGESKTDPASKPTVFNVLLTGDHDRGTLNSEFFLRYHFSRRWSIKAVYQFIFTEYSTQQVVQVAPDGTEVSRFRNKANNFGIGLAYHLKK